MTFSYLQSSSATFVLREFTKITDRSCTIRSASSFSTLGCSSHGPTDLSSFKIARGFRVTSLLTLGSSHLFPTFILHTLNWALFEEDRTKVGILQSCLLSASHEQFSNYSMQGTYCFLVLSLALNIAENLLIIFHLSSFQNGETLFLNSNAGGTKAQICLSKPSTLCA